jgi:hypothetical protein
VNALPCPPRVIRPTRAKLRLDPASVEKSCNCTLRTAFDREPFENLPDDSDIFLRARDEKYPIGLQTFALPWLQLAFGISSRIYKQAFEAVTRRAALMEPHSREPCLRRIHLDGQLTTVFPRHGSLKGLD